ncbi:DNA-binding protein [Haladaptatus sp. NG-SE-30]
MSSKRTLGQVVSVDEQALEQEDEERFEVAEEELELRPSVEQTIQARVDTNHPDGVGQGLTLAAEERLVAREMEIERTRVRWDRSQESNREAQCQTVVAQGSKKRRRAFHERAASVDAWCDPERRDPREELTQEQLAAVNKQAMRLEMKLDGWSRAAISRRLAERVADGAGMMSAVVGVCEELRTAPGQVIPIADVQDVNRKEVSIQGTITQLWEPSHPSIAWVGILEDDTGTIKVTTWKRSYQPCVREGDRIEVRHAARSFYQGRPSIAATGWTEITFKNGEWGWET